MIAAAPDDLPPVGHGSAEACQVKISVRCGDPGIGPAECAGVLVQRRDPAAARFAQIIHRGPAEVTDHVGIAHNRIPVRVQCAGEGLRAEEYPLRMQRMLPLIACVGVVVTDHVQNIAGLLHIWVDQRASGDQVHHIRSPDDIIDAVRCHCLLLLPDDLTNAGGSGKHNIQAVGNKTGGIQTFKGFHQLPAPLGPDGISGIRDLIADGPQNDAGGDCNPGGRLAPHPLQNIRGNTPNSHRQSFPRSRCR